MWSQILAAAVAAAAFGLYSATDAAWFLGVGVAALSLLALSSRGLGVRR